MHNKTPTLWYHKIKFNITKSISDITKSTLCYQKINLIFCMKNRFCDTYIYKKKKKKTVISKNLHDLVISQIRFFDIIKSIFLYKTFWLIWWYHKIIYVISKNRICDITKSRWFLISKHLFCDITKYVEFLVDEMTTPVFYLCYYFYIPADTKFRACTLIIFGSYHYSKEL